MNLFGFILTAAGFLAGAFLTSLDPETVRWGLFVPCLLVGAAGRRSCWRRRRCCPPSRPPMS